MIDRRAFLAALGLGALASSGAAQAQPAGKVPLVGVMNSGAGPRSTTIDITRQGLRDLGYIDGQTIAFDVRFGPNQPEYYKRLAVFIDKILKGAKPADLLIEQPTKFNFVINLKTAKTIGLALSQSLVARADQVIQ